LSKPETLAEVNTRGNREFTPQLSEVDHAARWKNWQRAVERSRGWEEGVDAEA